MLAVISKLWWVVWMIRHRRKKSQGYQGNSYSAFCLGQLWLADNDLENLIFTSDFFFPVSVVHEINNVKNLLYV